MKECVECGKNLGIMEGYRHPTLGKDNLLCCNCFDPVFKSIEKYRECVSPYVIFFNKESSIIDDIQKIREHITITIKKMQIRFSNLWFHNTNQNANEDLTSVHQQNINMYSGKNKLESLSTQN